MSRARSAPRDAALGLMWLPLLTEGRTASLGYRVLTEAFGDLQDGDTVAARDTDEVKAGTAVRVKDATSAKS